MGFLCILKMYHVRLFIVEENGVWNSSQMMWDSFQILAIIAENLHFLCFLNPSCIRRSVPMYAGFGPHMQAVAHVRGQMATLVFLFSKIDFCLLKKVIFSILTLLKSI